MRFVSAAAVSLFTLLLSPLGAAGQPHSGFVLEVGLEVTDPAGDVHSLDGDQVEAPGYVDIRLLRVLTEDDELVVTFELSGEPPADALTGAAFYNLDVDTDADGSFDRRLRAFLDMQGWMTQLTDLDSTFEQVGVPLISDDRVEMRVPLSMLGPVEDLRFLGSVEAHDVSGLFDRVPNRPDEWLSLDVEDATSSSPSPDTALRIDALLGEDVPHRDAAEVSEELDAVQREFGAYLDQRPLVRYQVDEVPLLLDIALDLAGGPDILGSDFVEWDFLECETDLGGGSIPRPEELALMDIMPIGPSDPLSGLAGSEDLVPGACVTAYGDLYEAYALTGSEEVYDLLGRFVQATASGLEGESQRAYLQALADVPTRMQKQIHEWYWIRDR